MVIRCENMWNTSNYCRGSLRWQTFTSDLRASDLMCSNFLPLIHLSWLSTHPPNLSHSCTPTLISSCFLCTFPPSILSSLSIFILQPTLFLSLLHFIVSLSTCQLFRQLSIQQIKLCSLVHFISQHVMSKLHFLQTFIIFILWDVTHTSLH